MAMSHADCDHPATPKERAKCRRRQETIAGVVEDARLERDTPRPRKAATRSLKAIHDLADVPHAFGSVIRWAWNNDLSVTTGLPYNEDERRVVIASDHGWLTLVWKAAAPNGIHASFWRPRHSSVASRLMTVNVGIDRLKGDVE